MIAPAAPELDCRVAALAIVVAWCGALGWRVNMRAVVCVCGSCKDNRARWVYCRERTPGVAIH